MWDTRTRYGELASQLHAEIKAGTLRPGDKLPSIRALCAQFKGSTATVTHALYLLEDAGLIAARARSGFYVCDQAPVRLQQQQRPVAAAQPALPTQRMLLRELSQLHSRDQPLLFAAMNPALYPVTALQRIMTTQVRRKPALLSMDDCDISPLAEQLARRGRLLGCEWQPEDIAITHGEHATVHAFLRLLTQPGDAVAIQSPANMRLLEELDAAGLRALEIPTHPLEGLSIGALEFALKRERVAACVFSANFPNPTGSLMSDEAKRRTVALLAQHGVPLIEDDENGELYFGKHRPLPFKAFDQTGLVHYCADLSDLIGPGLSIGFVVSTLQLNMLHRPFGASPPSLFQHTLAAFMASGLFEPHLRRLRQTLAGYAEAYQAAAQKYFPAEARSYAGFGGHWLWVELPYGFDTRVLLRSALAQGIAFSPGQLFCTDDSLNHCFRLNMGLPLTVQTEKYISTLGELIRAQLAQPG